jgi:hypothetical protein
MKALEFLTLLDKIEQTTATSNRSWLSTMEALEFLTLLDNGNI